MSDDLNFDMQAAWLRRFKADAERNLTAFALRLKEAMPELVTVHESRGFFSGGRTTGVSVELGENRYSLELERGRLIAKIAMVVRGIVLNTKTIDPAEWFAKLAGETKKATEHARALSQSLSQFMVS
ncbi:MAG TPA: hypothetical protein VKR55_15975 [Bradyrhizobium sp.]|uniref:hypothetical protein n=1 Tax=Bradyrhizobium sp. TaxID=376 RepID=UPI002CB600DA|nr:hypothetical protein [Bradyrhizobium sp.]HLZ03633.1 hypothetical protein [Bradyrhizobium sp.]